MTLRTTIRAAMTVAAFSQVAIAQTADTVRMPVRFDANERKSWLIPAIELPSFILFLSGAARVLYGDQMEDGRKVYASTLNTTWEHLRDQNWIHDKDPFDVNQFRHPYLGATMYGLMRTTGHGFLSSLVYSNVGSFMWEMAGETGLPSKNDIITTSQAGSLLGEALYRIAATIHSDRPGDDGGFWRGLLADVISPPRALNRRVFGDYKTNLSDADPAVAWQLRLGATIEAEAKGRSDANALLQRDAAVEYGITYGLPGQPDYDYHHPLSYFDLQMSLLFNRENPIENVAVRGLLLGRKSGSRPHTRGIWGLYGSYDYFSPYLFRVSSTALSLGMTRQDWLGQNVALQTSLLGGGGWGAAGTIEGIPATTTTEATRDYHHGITPQGLVALRLILGNRLMLDGTARGYYVSGLGSDNEQGSERIVRMNAGFTLRVFDGHSVGIRWVTSTRDAKYGTLPDRRLSGQNVTVSYSLVGRNRFGAVRWE